MHVTEVIEYRTIGGAPWAKVRTGQQPKPEWRPLAELMVRGAA